MREMQLLLLTLCVFSFHLTRAQKQIDSTLAAYINESDGVKKSASAGRLSLMYLAVDLKKSDSFARKSIEHAELSRDRKAMVKAYLYNGERYLQLAGIRENIPRAIDNIQKAYVLARESKLKDEMVSALLKLAQVYRTVPDADKAMSQTNQAFSLISESGADSLQAECYLSFGDNYNLKKERLLALRNFFNASRIAEITKNHSLQRTCHLKLAEFYFYIENYDKAIDYTLKATEKLDDIKKPGSELLRINDLSFVGSIFVQKKEYDLAISTFERALKMADSLKQDNLKIPVYLGIFNTYLLSNQAEKAKAYFDNSGSLKEYIIRLGLGGVLDHAYGYIYTELGVLDSAKYYYEKALPFFEQNLNNQNRVVFFEHVSRLHLKSGDYPAAIDMLQKAKATAIEMEDIEWQQSTYKKLDSAYQLQGDYKQALFYANLSQSLKDTLDLLGKEDDILQLQIADEQDRQARLVRENEEKRQRRHQFQYLAITIGIAVSFVVLVMLGLFKVSAKTIKIIGFFTFLMFFEFVFLIFKKNIYSITAGEPWKDLALMIALAAILLPLHHWLEHKVIHYLTTNKLLKIEDNNQLLKSIFKKKKLAAREAQLE